MAEATYYMTLRSLADASGSNCTSMIVMTLTVHRRNIRVTHLKAISNFHPPPPPPHTHTHTHTNKQGPDLESFITSVESDIASHMLSKPKHDKLTKSERSAFYGLQNRQEIIINPLTRVLRLLSWIEIATSQRLRDN